MNKSLLLDELMQLSPAERLDIADRLWESVDPNDPALADDLAPLTEEQMAEIDRRLAEHERNPERAKPWNEVLARLRARFDK
jgi:putative addiction module component (TIGR02574 family)